MRSLILLALVILAILSVGETEFNRRYLPIACFCLVRSRTLKTLDDDDDDVEQSGEHFIDPPSYSNLFKLLKRRKTNRHKYDENDGTQTMAPRKLVNAHLLRLDKPPAGRPSSAYGQKAHWDTFFGRK